MRIACYYDDHRRVGRNDGGPLYVWNVLKNQLGHDVEHLIPDARRLQGFGRFDAHIWVDFGEDALVGLLDYQPITCPKPSIYWASDTHLGYTYRLQKAREFDHVFVAQKQAIEDFARDGVKATWLPHAFEPKAYPKIEAIKNYDVSFVGNIGSDNRIDFLDRMFKEFPNFFYGRRLFEEAAAIYGRSKIVINMAIKDDLNMRVFEALGTGSFLLTSWTPDINEVFAEGRHLVTFKTLDEAVEKARYYLAHDEEREKIAKAGYEEVISKHTYRHRVEAMLAHAGLTQVKEVVCP